MKTRNITKAVFIDAEWMKGAKALEEAKKISNNFTLDSAPIHGITSYTFMYSDDTIFIYFNPS